MTHPHQRTAAAVLALAFALPAAAAQDPLLPPAIVAARARFERLVSHEEAALVPELWELGEWCRARKLYLERDRLARMILAIDPEHGGARKALKYHRRGEEWVQSNGYRLPRNHARVETREQYTRALAEVTDPFRSKLFRRLEKDGRLLAAGTREAVLRRMLVLDPQDLALRTVLGERQLKGRWVLEETARAAGAGTGVTTDATEALDQVERPGIDTPSKAERKLELLWNATRRTPHVRVVGTTPRAEVDETARVTEAVGDYFQRVFGDDQLHRRGYTIYLLRDPSEREILIEGLGHIDQATKDLLRRAAGGWLGAPNLLGEWDANPARRLDGAARQTLGTLLMDAYGIDGSHGWAWEGMGLYLVYRLVGTRLTYFIDHTGYGTNRATTLWPRLQQQETQWLVEARGLLARENAPRLAFLLGRSVDTMRDEDLLYAYALAAFLLEGRPEDVPRILRRIGAGEHPVTVFEEVTGYALPDLELRLRRWLDEILR